MAAQQLYDLGIETAFFLARLAATQNSSGAGKAMAGKGNSCGHLQFNGNIAYGHNYTSLDTYAYAHDKVSVPTGRREG